MINGGLDYPSALHKSSFPETTSVASSFEKLFSRSEFKETVSYVPWEYGFILSF